MISSSWKTQLKSSCRFLRTVRRRTWRKFNEDDYCTSSGAQRFVHSICRSIKLILTITTNKPRILFLLENNHHKASKFHISTLLLITVCSLGLFLFQSCILWWIVMSSWTEVVLDLWEMDTWTATGEGFPVAVISTILQILTPETVIVDAKVSFRVTLVSNCSFTLRTVWSFLWISVSYNPISGGMGFFHHLHLPSVKINSYDP